MSLIFARSYPLIHLKNITEIANHRVRLKKERLYHLRSD